jgi:hypothetical protein
VGSKLKPEFGSKFIPIQTRVNTSLKAFFKTIDLELDIEKEDW